ncbi:MAG: hypothetical protein AB4038_11450 [Prochloraceae cyanobacterium]
MLTTMAIAFMCTFGDLEEVSFRCALGGHEVALRGHLYVRPWRALTASYTF